jgi:hypothetical protein
MADQYLATALHKISNATTSKTISEVFALNKSPKSNAFGSRLAFGNNDIISMLNERQLYEITASDTSFCFDDLCPIKYAMPKHISTAPKAYGTCNNTLKHTPSNEACAKVSPKKARPFHKPMHPRGAVIKLARRPAIMMKKANESIMMMVIVVMLIGCKTRE